jgi:hypothetical protein
VEEPTRTNGDSDGPVGGWVTPPRPGPDSRLDRIVKVVAVAVVLVMIAAFLAGFAFAWFAGPNALLPWEATPPP